MNNSVLYRVLIATVLAVIAGLLTSPESAIAGVPVVRLYDLMGNLFLNALTLVVVPLVASSIITGTSRLGNDHAFAKLGRRTCIAFVSTGVLAVLLGMALTLLIQPGSGVSQQAISGSAPDLATLSLVEGEAVGGVYDKIEQLLFRMVPSNILAVAASGQMLGLICFSIAFGVFATRIEEPLSELMINFWRALFRTMMKITEFVMGALPLGVFGLVAKVVAQTGLDAVRPIVWFVATDLIGLLLFGFVVLPLLLAVFVQVSPIAHLRNITPAIITAFSTSSTAATLPVTIECMEKRAKVQNRICSFTLPLGTSLNLTGSALHTVVAVLFLAQASDIALTVPMLMTIALMGVFASLGMVAGVPSASLVTILVILQTAGIPADKIVLILLAERLLDMVRTTISVISNTCCTLFVAK